jgi:hypothetical protein
LVIATDGTPLGCSTSNSVAAIAAALGAAKGAVPPIATYVVGVFSPDEVAQVGPQLDRLAAAGGTGKAFVVMTGTDLKQKLQDAFNRIRGAALACEFKIPAPGAGAIDFQKVNVHYTSGTPAGAPQDLLYVGKAERCDPARGGWYYDVDPSAGTPTTIKTCDASCRRFQLDATVRVDLVFGCATQVIP